MGWNEGYTIMESTVMGAYKLGVLDKKLLRVLIKPYAGTDIDEGGCCDIRVNGLGIAEVVITVGGGKLPKKPRLPRNVEDWTDEHTEADNDYTSALCDEFDRVTRRIGGW
jgi:hypothetical protein